MAGRWSNAILRRVMSRYGLKTMERGPFERAREVYASTGPRIIAPLCGWGFTGEELDDADFAAQGYSAERRWVDG